MGITVTPGTPIGVKKLLIKSGDPSVPVTVLTYVALISTVELISKYPEASDAFSALK